ncbi:MAG: ribonucleoside-triphosphate reductase activating protein [Epulopiscium sp. Nele67-Bin002]|nr:MAG: anaerobic ribonucleoside-triphosphate reductase activating protein [Epulopiscium sp. Nuni2H_MBin001]OON91413.1 MAG: ribonucleoside-triphosphate reductase activating protein [Epulopiscium sp. Nele67-Bin002]OON92420.1 MAG: anaerobic ribonucleoside-triphosphate reductase activating protein [Epulopiscium sp. Nele67-Bin001]
MHYSQIRKYDTANGVGIRTTLFVSGCTRNCKGCFNAEYKNFKHGTEWTDEIELDFIEHINLPQIQGVSILGGEPMDQTFDHTFANLLRNIKLRTNKNIWIYSGYTFEELVKDHDTLAILKYCDVLADGPFIEEKKDIRLAFVGSSNQRLIDVQQSLLHQKIILFKLP